MLAMHADTASGVVSPPIKRHRASVAERAEVRCRGGRRARRPAPAGTRSVVLPLVPVMPATLHVGRRRAEVTVGRARPRLARQLRARRHRRRCAGSAGGSMPGHRLPEHRAGAALDRIRGVRKAVRRAALAREERAAAASLRRLSCVMSVTSSVAQRMRRSRSSSASTASMRYCAHRARTPWRFMSRRCASPWILRLHQRRRRHALQVVRARSRATASAPDMTAENTGAAHVAAVVHGRRSARRSRRRAASRGLRRRHDAAEHRHVLVVE